VAQTARAAVAVDADLQEGQIADAGATLKNAQQAYAARAIC